MIFRSKIIPALFAGILVAGCGGSSSGSGPTPPPDGPTVPFSALPKGSFSLALNRTGVGELPGDQNIYVQIVSQPCVNSSPCVDGDVRQITYVTLKPNVQVTEGPNGNASLGVVSVGQPNESLPSFKLADLKNGNLILPGDEVYSSRIFISVGAPLHMSVDAKGEGYVQTNFSNPSDPNIATSFDFVEFAYDAKPRVSDPTLNTVAFGANLTQVDQFGLPLAFQITGISDTVLHRGITLGSNSSSKAASRQEVIQDYLNSVSVPFQGLAQTVNGRVIRILAPYHSASFQSGGAYANYYDAYVNEVWTYFQQNPDTIVYDQPGNMGNQYKINSNGTTLSITRNGLGPFLMQKPTSLEVFMNAGALQPGGTEINAFGAMLAGALNRHVATQAQAWLTPGQYYLLNPSHSYAKFWHQISINNLAYGFGFDDSADQSSVAILTPAEDVASLNVQIGW